MGGSRRLGQGGQPSPLPVHLLRHQTRHPADPQHRPDVTHTTNTGKSPDLGLYSYHSSHQDKEELTPGMGTLKKSTGFHTGSLLRDRIAEEERKREEKRRKYEEKRKEEERKKKVEKRRNEDDIITRILQEKRRDEEEKRRKLECTTREEEDTHMREEEKKGI